MDVEENDVDVLAAEQLLCTLDRRRLEHAISLELEIHTAQHSQAVVVVDDEHGVSDSPHVATATIATVPWRSHPDWNGGERFGSEASLVMPIKRPRGCKIAM
jgi:hypothetical protein